MSSQNDDQSLIIQAKAGDRAALERLLLDYAPKIAKHIDLQLQRTKQAKIAVDDILQDTLLKAFLGIHTIEKTTPRAFAAWLKSIADMRLLDAFKAQGRQKRGGHLRQVPFVTNDQEVGLVNLVDQLPSDISTASKRLARHEAAIAIQIGLASLPHDQREAIRLHYIQGKNVAEVAEKMGRTTSAVRSLVHRGRQNLAEALGRASLWLSG